MAEYWGWGASITMHVNHRIRDDGGFTTRLAWRLLGGGTERPNAQSQ